jgi:fructose/tagatose bisphosphate aldolase
MIDGSHLSYEENIELTKKVVAYAHQFDVTVEGELGVLAGIEDEVSAATTPIPSPKKLKTLLQKPVSTALPFLSAPHTVLSNSSRVKIQKSVSTSFMKSKSVFLASLSFCMAPLPFRRSW